jgi:hypothetical protein
MTSPRWCSAPSKAPELKRRRGRRQGWRWPPAGAGTDTFTFLINHAENDARYRHGPGPPQRETVTGTAVVTSGAVRVIHMAEELNWDSDVAVPAQSQLRELRI